VPRVQPLRRRQDSTVCTFCHYRKGRDHSDQPWAWFTFDSKEELLYQALLSDPRFHRLLRAIDDDLAAACHAAGCPLCRGALHWARYPRKPRGMPCCLREEYAKRNSFCCAVEDCRKRTTPASVRFLGAKVYLATVVTLISALQHAAKASSRQLAQSLGVDRRTVARWRDWWRSIFSVTPFWRAAAASFMPPADTDRLPASALVQFLGSEEERLIALLRFLGPLTGGRRMRHAF
jgi:hypothetical protein